MATPQTIFQISCSLKQGDCYSPPAFLMVVEILGQKIHLNERIEGIQIGKINKKHAQFAYDLWASILAKQTSIDALFDEIEKFCLATGLKINYNKTLIMRLGSLRESEAKLIHPKHNKLVTQSQNFRVVFYPRF